MSSCVVKAHRFYAVGSTLFKRAREFVEQRYKEHDI
jgi:hypothetical protein